MCVDLLKDKQKYIQIIGLFARAKKVKFQNNEQVSSYIRRYARASKNLVGYEMDRIIKTMHYLILNAKYKWTIETVCKYIDEDLETIKEYEHKGEYKCAFGAYHQNGLKCGCTDAKEFKF